MATTLYSLLSSLGITTAIPTYNQENPDPIDLQIKSLLYLFKRFRINKLAAFLDKDDLSLKYVDDTEEIEENQKLDEQFNIDQFLKLLINDEYRILVDFFKNKFRSYCILTEYPKGMEPSFPEFRDSKDQRVGQFRFLLFPTSGVTVEYVASLLSGSDIYCEHFSYLPYKARVRLALESIREVTPFEYKAAILNITLLQRTKIIRGYLTKMAFTVQLQRIYQERIKLNSPNKSDSVAKPNTSSSPIKIKPKKLAKMASFSNLNTQTSPSRLSPRKSMANLRPPSPGKQLKPKPSIPRFQLEELYNPVVSPVKPV
ncbi:uncharacterized protein SPAPADRAFT_60425, partial [Spathaspora passalidarum NRRL Y-27907]